MSLVRSGARVKAATDGKGAEVVLNAVGGPPFEPTLLSIRQGGRHVVLASSGEPRISFQPDGFLPQPGVPHRPGLDDVLGTGDRSNMFELKPSFEAGDFTLNELKTRPFTQGIAAYGGAAKGGTANQQILQMR